MGTCVVKDQNPLSSTHNHYERMFTYESLKERYDCDLNAENILLTPNMKAKISDFGVSCTFEPDPGKYYMKVSKIPGNRLCMPPEVWKDGYRLTGDKLDVFSFGLLILHVCTQKFPKPIDSRDECTEVQKRQHLLDEAKDDVIIYTHK